MTVNRRRIVGLAISVALHAALFAALVVLPPVRNGVAATEQQRTVAIAYIGNPGEPAAAEIFAELEIEDAPTTPAQVRMPGFELDIARIRARQDALFPFLTEELSVVDDLRAVAAARAARLTWFSPSPPARSHSVRPSLIITDAQLTLLVDRAWSRRERWRSFMEIAALVAKHDPDDGRAHELLRTHLDQNLLQPYYDTTTRDPRFWIMLNLASDHAPIIRFVSRFAREHPSTRSTTELLFLLDEFAQASRDALVMLMATDPELDLRLTRSADAGAYELAVSVRRHYREWLRERGLDSAEAIRSHYDRIRLRILSAIIDTTSDGYGASDARFLAGRIMWDQNKVSDAIGWWRDITPDARSLYAPVRDEILREIRAPSGSSVARINGALGAEYRRWLEFSARRLQEFGYTVDTF